MFVKRQRVHVWKAGVLLVVVSLLAGCGTSATAPELPAFEATVGTANYTGSQPFGTFFFFIFRLRNRAPADGLTVTVRGPQGWNNGRPLELRRSWLANHLGTWWDWDANSAWRSVSGEYVLETTIDGTVHRVRRSVDATAFLPLTSQINVTATRTQVDVSWTPVPGAASYQVGLYRADTLATISSVYLTGTQFSFRDLNLDPAVSYRVWVRAFGVETGVTIPPSLPPGQANYSRRDSATFQPAAATSVQVGAQPTGEAPQIQQESDHGRY